MQPPGAPGYYAGYPGVAPTMMYPAPPPQQPTALPIAAGVLYIVALLVGIWMTMSLLSAYNLSQSTLPVSGIGFNPFGMFGGVLLVMLILSIIGVVGCLMAAIFSLMRRQFALAVIGGVLAFVGLHFLFGLIGFILLLLGKDDFPKAQPAA